MLIPFSTAFGLLDVAGAIAVWPPMSFVIGLVAAATVVAIRANTSGGSERAGLIGARGSSLRRRYLGEHATLSIAGASVALGFVVEFLFRGYVWNGSGTSWWRVAAPLVVALVGVAATLAVIRTRGSGSPERPVSPPIRRSWISFSSRGALIALALTAVAVAATTIAAGIASSPNAEGEWVWLVVPIPNAPDVDPLRVTFYGWVYGVPALITLALLVITAWRGLDRSAARSFLRPEAVAIERAARRRTAGSIVMLSTGAALIALAAAWRLVGNAGSTTTLTIEDASGAATYDVAWRFAELASLAGAAAPIVEIIGLCLLLVVAGSLVPSAVEAVAPAPATSTDVGYAR
ncbi:hypothetical protein [Microbacterium sp. cf332]|uniref:hypothetical protein n=1 Tax=Microbacterium sp. cf332 TaxID=1761804 RepID=UPI000891F872|nr:hypothetical protein [Microbacterium sp. cf332]SDQ89123.1 hypothetical protein SAMN04487847_2892 [Microbacterium sp. cf332]